MVLHTFSDRSHISPCDKRVYQTVNALTHEVVVGEA